MINFTRIASLSLALTIAAAATADGFLQIPPTPDMQFSGSHESAPIYADQSYADPIYSEGTLLPGSVVHYDHAPIALYPNVKYKDNRKAHPCAVKKIIQVNDPCGHANACGPECVFIEICVPPDCCNEKVRCRRHGDRLRFDYGKYKVDVRVKKGYIVVDYSK